MYFFCENNSCILSKNNKTVSLTLIYLKLICIKLITCQNLSLNILNGIFVRVYGIKKKSDGGELSVSEQSINTTMLKTIILTTLARFAPSFSNSLSKLSRSSMVRSGNVWSSTSAVTSRSLFFCWVISSVLWVTAFFFFFFFLFHLPFSAVSFQRLYKMGNTAYVTSDWT